MHNLSECKCTYLHMKSCVNSSHITVLTKQGKEDGAWRGFGALEYTEVVKSWNHWLCTNSKGQVESIH